MQAIILAAGMGKRLKELTQNNTKCMVKVNNRTLIERMLSQLDKKNFSRIIIVVGYEGQKLIDYISSLDIKKEILYIQNPIYDKTNNIYSLSLAKDYLCAEDTILLESDLIFEESILDLLLNDPRDTLALVDKYENWMDGTCVKLSENDSIEDFVPGKKIKFTEIEFYYKTVNIYKFSKHFSQTHYVPFLEAYTKALGNNEYYEQVLRVITMLDDPEIKAKRLNGEAWYEIDDIQDLDIASSMFADDSDKFNLLQERYGGYWRYPRLLDFCYLVNPFFPPRKLLEEIKASFDKLITQYPSGMKINSLIAAKNFGIHPDNILVGNGAAELIKVLMELLDGKCGFVKPTFEEYPNRYAADKSTYYVPQSETFSYNENDLIDFFDNKHIDNLIIVNPDNPTGNYISQTGLMKIVDWSQKKGIKLIIDESFVDFSDELNCTLITQKILDHNPHLLVVKSISKSYGIPGLRLGILATGNKSIIKALKKNVAIWNINSFAEFYMQIEEKYKKEYVDSLEQIRTERNRFISKLSSIKSIKVFPSQANYVMVELLNGNISKNISEQMLAKYNILIKDLSPKADNGRQYLRLAVRNAEDNAQLIYALDNLLN